MWWNLNRWVLLSSAVWILGFAHPIAAQVVPDATLPVRERSQITGNPNIQIDGGARRGGNLFHSFSQFSIPTGGSVYFNNALDVQNIFSRVTGGSVSNIDGAIRANGTANLFLLNPNGILFGPNASLNIGGSFVATTANAIGFPNGEIFSSDATQPLLSQLLTVNPNALFFNQLAAGSLINRSTANNGTGLQVPAGQSLLLVGGNVQLEGGQIISPGSRVELGAIAGQGTVGLSKTAGDWRLSFPDTVARADVSLSDAAQIDVRAEGSGSITITTGNLTLNQSVLWVGIADGLGSAGAQSGDLQLAATAVINLMNDSLIGTRVGFGSTGNAGNINIRAGSVFVTNAQLGSDTFGQGNAGSININARDTVSLDGGSTILGTAVQPIGIGNAGDLNITTGSLFITSGAKSGSVTRGLGNTGDVNINARDTISMDAFGFIGSGVDATAIGNSGEISITTGSLSLTNEAQVVAYARGQGNAGGVSINARDRIFLKSAPDPINNLGTIIASIVEPTGFGNSGGINITTGSLLLTEGAQLLTNTAGRGNAGSVRINARDQVSLDGGTSELFTSDIITQVSQGAVGQGGDVTITTGSLSLTHGGSVASANFGGIGNAGRVVINARDSIQISGAFPVSGAFSVLPVYGDSSSQVITSVALGAVGSGGDVSITTGSLSVSDQGKISTRSQGQGQAGNIQIQARDAVSFDGGDAISTLSPGGVGRGGDIDVTARSLSVRNGAQLSASTSGDGDAGNIRVKTPDLQLSGAISGLFAQTTSTGNAGNLTIQPPENEQNLRVSLQQGAQISASTSGTGRGGQLTISAPGSITLTGDGSIITAGTEGSGGGGDLTLRTGTLNIQNRAEVTVSSSGAGRAGSLFVDADRRILLDNQGSIRADTAGGGGNINLRSPFILLRNGSNITTNATGANIPGGNIGIDTRFLVAVLNEDSNISANSEDFRGGNVRINAFSIFGIQPSLVSTPLSDITATGATSALSGTINITTAGFDPTAGLVALPTGLVDSSRLIAQGCAATQGNSFVISGRGGLPPTPEQQLDDDAEWIDQRTLIVAGRGGRGDTGTQGSGDTGTRGHGEAITNLSASSTSSTPIVEATRWQITPTGEIFLTADTPDSTVQNPLNQPVACQRSKEATIR